MVDTRYKTAMPQYQDAERPWRTGNFAATDFEVTAHNLAVTGTVPDALAGRLVRNGPNAIGSGDAHFFNGEGMVHGVRLRGGRAEWYRNRWVRSPHVAQILGEQSRRPELSAPTPVAPQGDIAPSVHIMKHAGRTFALTEGGVSRPYELTYELETLGPWDFDGTLPESWTSHPKRDPDTGELHAASYHLGWGAKVQYTILGTDGRVRHCVDIPTGRPVWMHDISITKNYVIFYDLPTVLKKVEGPDDFFVEWDPSYPARVGVMPKEGTAEELRWFEVGQCSVAHALNAFEDGNDVVCDVVRHSTAFLKDGWAFTHKGWMDSATTLDRWTIDMSAGGRLKEERLDDHSQEMPRIDERREGRPYRFGYSSAMRGGSYIYGSSVLQHDLAKGAVTEHAFGPGAEVAEPIYVPASEHGAEDDGWVMTFVYSWDRNASDLVILNACDFSGEPAATIHLPVRVPNGAHGNWLPDD